MYFPEKLFIVLGFGDEIHEPYEDADPFPFDLFTEKLEKELKYSLGVIPYSIQEERTKDKGIISN